MIMGPWSDLTTSDSRASIFTGACIVECYSHLVTSLIGNRYQSPGFDFPRGLGAYDMPLDFAVCP